MASSQKAPTPGTDGKAAASNGQVDRPETGSGAAALDVESVVRERYSEGAQAQVPELCCPVDYDPQYLEVIPQEVLDRDYGCGDPSKWLMTGETVLDLGSGTGKICYIASQVVGASGRVIGVDMNTEMLQVARDAAPVVADRIGFSNVEFRRGRIQDLSVDHDRLSNWLAENPVQDSEGVMAMEAEMHRLRTEEPLVAADSVDVVVSNCVLNLVRNDDKKQLFEGIFRVLKKGGRAVISDIVSDEDVPQEMQNDSELWSGCISGAFREDLFLKAFEDAGFYGIRIVARGSEPWTTVEGIEFRSMTVEATKGKQGPCLERNQAVVYMGPWKQVVDDDGHVLRRGERMAVCDKTYRLYQRAPYGDSIVPVPPLEEIPLEDAKQYDCRAAANRHPRLTKGEDYNETIEGCDTDCC